MLVVSEIRKSIACLIVLRTKQCSNCFSLNHFSVTWRVFFNLRLQLWKRTLYHLSYCDQSTRGDSLEVLLIAWSFHCSLVVICWERADHLTLVCDVNLCIGHFSMWYPGSGVVLDCIESWCLPLLLHCTKQYALSSVLFMILLENIVIRQRSYFIQFIHISFKDPWFISSNHLILPTLIIIGICSGVRVLVMIRLMFAHYTLSCVWVAEWPPFEKELPTRLAICSYCVLVYLYFIIIINLVLRARCGFWLLQFLFIAFLVLT